MAKKKEQASMCFLLKEELQTNDNQAGRRPGVIIPWYCVRHLLDSDIIRLGEVIQLVGYEQTNKSLFGFELVRLFLMAGGFAAIIDTEDKLSVDNTLRPALGEAMFPRDPAARRFIVKVSKSINGEDSWQEAVDQLVDDYKADEEASKRPFIIVVDSLLGSGLAEVQKKHKESGGVSKARSTDGAARAGAISAWFNGFLHKLVGTNILLVFVNHLGVNISMDGMPSYGPKDKVLGGQASQFKSSTILKFRKHGVAKLKNMESKIIDIKVLKNSFGCDGRSMQVDFIADMARGPDGEFVRDDAGFPRRRLYWDWDAASGRMMSRFCVGISDKDKKESVSEETKKLFPGMKVKAQRVSIPSEDIEGWTWAQLGRAITERPKLYDTLMQHIKLAVNNTPKDIERFVPVRDDASDALAAMRGDEDWDDAGSRENLAVDDEGDFSA